jgi:hypothetical protein
MPEQQRCSCLDPQYDKRQWTELSFHNDVQDINCTAWLRLLDMVDDAAADGRAEFNPAEQLGWDQWLQIVTLPRSIAKLKQVRVLHLYGSNLVRIPPEIGEMSSLEVFDPYTSYRLHWFPYEITRCPKLKGSTISTRALYGNYKYRPPFPRLPQNAGQIHSTCSVCNGPFPQSMPRQCWISLRVATDVMPLLVNACSTQCLAALPQPAQYYVQDIHEGGLDLQQPDGDHFYG